MGITDVRFTPQKADMLRFGINVCKVPIADVRFRQYYAETVATRSRRQEPIIGVSGAYVFFATLYFVQSVGDPTSGLIAQPVRSLFRSWGNRPPLWPPRWRCLHCLGR